MVFAWFSRKWARYKATRGRSPHWPTVRKHHLQEHPTCAVCGGSSHLDVHHKMPWHLDPSKELDFSNLITLCRKSEVLGGCDCHLVFGHFGNWSLFDPNVDENAKSLLPQIQKVRGKT